MKTKLHSITELNKYMYTSNLFVGSLGLKETVLIIGIVLLVVAIIIGIGIALYIKSCLISKIKLASYNCERTPGLTTFT